MISVATLIAAGIDPTQARQFADPLAAACARFEINTPARIASFVSQCSHESTQFIHLEEDLFYSTPERIRQMWPREVASLGDAATLVRKPQALANRVYAGRNGNGNEASGDGWTFRGRGLIQTTGRANYAALNGKLDQDNDFVSVPDMLAQPDWACLSAAFFFVSHGCLPLADASNTDAVTRAINGPGMEGADDRRLLFQEALRAFMA